MSVFSGEDHAFIIFILFYLRERESTGMGGQGERERENL